MSRFHDLMAADLATQAPAAQPGESAPAETQPAATGTPSAPAHALGEESASQTTPPATETAATAAITPAEPAAVEQPAEATGAQPPANEPPAVPQMRQTIETLKSKLDEQKPLLEPITSRFTSEDEMRPFLSVVDAARERDPLQAAQKVGDSLFQMLGAERYGALVGDLTTQHLDFIIEQHRDEIAKRLGVTPAASGDERVFEDDDDEPAKTSNPQLSQLQQENEALKQQLAQLNGQSAAVQEQQRIATMRGQVLQPLKQAMDEVAGLGAGFEGVPERIRAEVLTQFQSNPQLVEAFETVAEMAARNEPPHLYSQAVKTMREAVQGLTEKALNYHKRVASAPVTQQQQAHQKALAAAEQTQRVEVARAASSAQPVVPPAPAPAATQQEKPSLRKQLFDKSEIKAGFNEMRQAGRF